MVIRGASWHPLMALDLSAVPQLPVAHAQTHSGLCPHAGDGLSITASQQLLSLLYGLAASRTLNAHSIVGGIAF